MDRKLWWSTALIALLWAASAGLAQEPPEALPPAYGPAEGVEQRDEGNGSPDLREMAKSMKSMADMCQMMMQQEMQHRPLLIAVGAGLGTVVAVALVLFVILEVQWIRYWSLRIRSERRGLG
jgi:hypothetical protein